MFIRTVSKYLILLLIILFTHFWIRFTSILYLVTHARTCSKRHELLRFKGFDLYQKSVTHQKSTDAVKIYIWYSQMSHSTLVGLYNSFEWYARWFQKGFLDREILIDNHPLRATRGLLCRIPTDWNLTIFIYYVLYPFLGNNQDLYSI